MSSMPYPTASDLIDFVTSATIPVGFAEMFMAAASRAWERDTRWQPFLSSGAIETATFSRMRGEALFGGDIGFLSVSNVAIDGLVMPPSRYELKYRNTNGPARAIFFHDFQTRALGSPVVTGVFGYCLTLPDDAQLAILQKGAAAAFRWLSSSAAGDVRSETAGPVKIEYSVSQGQDRISRCEAEYNDAVSRYRRSDI